MEAVRDALQNNKKEILIGILQDVLDFIEQEVMYRGFFIVHDKKIFNDYIMTCLKDYLIYNFSLQSYDIYSITEEDVKKWTEDYFFKKENYNERAN